MGEKERIGEGTGDSQASSKRSDSATGSPLTPSGDEMRRHNSVFFTFLEKTDPKGHKV